jgi:hypothetical protein
MIHYVTVDNKHLSSNNSDSIAYKIKKLVIEFFDKNGKPVLDYLVCFEIM